MSLLSKRVARRALAATAAAALVGSFAVTSNVSAQTNNASALTVTTTVVGPVPSGTSGYLVSVTCNNLLGIPAGLAAGDVNANTGSQTLQALFGTTASSQALTFGLNATNVAANYKGSFCTAVTQISGTNTLGNGAAAIIYSWGGATKPANYVPGLEPASGPYYYIRGNAGTALPTDPNATKPVPVTGPSTLSIVIAYPSITVKKVVSGDEPTPGYAYPMTIACSNSPANSTAVFVAGNNGNAIPTGYTTGQIVIGVGGPGNGGFVKGTLGTYSDASSFTALTAAQQADFLATAAALTSTTAVAPVGAAAGFDGTFTLAGGANRIFGIDQFPTLSASRSRCEVTETGSQGSVLSYSSTTGTTNGVANTPATGVLVNGVFKSALTAMGETVTVTNSFTGDLIISKVVSGDPKTNIATYEITVACDKAGPRETFLLKDRQSKVYNGIPVGANCLITEGKSDGAVASYSDNSGDNATDGRVTIKLPQQGCSSDPLVRLTSSNNCYSNVIVTNTYVLPTTTAAPSTTTAAATAAAPAPTTAAPAVSAAPATPVADTATFTG